MGKASSFASAKGASCIIILVNTVTANTSDLKMFKDIKDLQIILVYFRSTGIRKEGWPQYIFKLEIIFKS